MIVIPSNSSGISLIIVIILSRLILGTILIKSSLHSLFCKDSIYLKGFICFTFSSKIQVLDL